MFVESDTNVVNYVQKTNLVKSEWIDLYERRADAIPRSRFPTLFRRFFRRFLIAIWQQNFIIRFQKCRVDWNSYSHSSSIFIRKKTPLLVSHSSLVLPVLLDA